MGFFTSIIQAHGQEVVNQMKQQMKITRKLSSLYNRRIFLLRCRTDRLFPNFIINSIKCLNNIISNSHNINIQQVTNLEIKLKTKILNLEISHIQQNIGKFQQMNENLKINIKSLLPTNVYNNFQNRLNKSYVKLFNKTKDSCVKKYKKLQDNENIIKYQAEWIKNLTDLNIPQEVLAILSLGPKFSIKPHNTQINIFNYLAEIENIMTITKNKNNNIKRALITNKITNWLTQPQNYDKFQTNYLKTSKYLKQHPELVVTMSDKGNKVVILYANDYKTKMLTLLSDQKKFTKLDKDPTLSLQVKFNKTITSLQENELLTKQEAAKLRIYNASPPRIFGYVKTHKPELPLRPIVDTAGSVFTSVSLKLKHALTEQFATIRKFNITDTFQLVEKLQNFKLPEDHILVSLDIVNMFPSIPFQLIQYDINLHWKEIKQFTTFDKNTFLMILEFIYNNSYFMFDDQAFVQRTGLPIGDHLSAILSARVIHNQLTFILENLDFELPFLVLLVDDALTAVPKNKIEILLKKLNSYNKNIKFTHEEENIQKTIPYLDTLVHRDQENRIKFSWYRKPISSNRYLNYNSYCPQKYKLNVVKGMTHRIRKISSPEFLKEDLKKLYNLLRQNEYPDKVLKPIIFCTSEVYLQNPNTQRQPINNTPHTNTITYLSLPYIHSLSPLIKNLFNNPEITLSDKPITTLRNLHTKTKQKMENKYKTNSIYMLTCSCDKKYVGQTSQYLMNRMTLHKSNIKHKTNSCTLAQHINQNKHTVDLNNVKILQTEENTQKREFIEMCYISSVNNVMNLKRDINELSSIYANLINKQASKFNRVNNRQNT